jgi:hypothetical protein
MIQDRSELMCFNLQFLRKNIEVFPLSFSMAKPNYIIFERTQLNRKYKVKLKFPGVFFKENRPKLIPQKISQKRTVKKKIC